MISLYFDPVTNTHSYYSTTIDFLKNASELTLYGFYVCSLNQFNLGEKLNYEKVVDSMIEIVSTSEPSPTDEINDFYSQCDEYLKGKEKVLEIVLEPMWTWEDVENGTYKDIIREYFQ